MNKTELGQVLEKFGMRPGKMLGQNFLVDSNLLDFIVRSANVQPGEVILEAGPGFGALSQPLLNAGAQLYSIEFDRRICDYLRKEITADNFHLIEGDACRVNIGESLPKDEKFRAVANLPYSISSIFVARLLELENVPNQMIFMLQKEMAERLAAAFDCKDYGALSVRTQYLYDVKIIRVVPPTVFYPQPKVESAVVQFDLKKDVDMDMRFRKRLSSVTKTAFLQRRKQMCKVLSGNFDRTRVESAFEKLGIRAEVRPAALTVEDFVKLTRELM